MKPTHHNKKKESDTFCPSSTWKALCDGSHSAFTRIYNFYFHDLCRYASRLSGDRAIIEDAIQDVFLDLWRTRKELPQVKSVKYYLFKRLKRKIIKKLVETRKSPIVRNILEDYDFKIVFSHESKLIAQQISKEQQSRLLRALNSLTRRQKEAITLKFLDGSTYEEIGGMLSMSPKSARNLIYRSMISLKKNIPKFFVSILLIYLISIMAF